MQPFFLQNDEIYCGVLRLRDGGGGRLSSLRGKETG